MRPTERAMSATWRHRLDTGRRRARTAGVVALVVCAVLGACAAAKVFLNAPHPDDADVAAIATRVANQRAAAGEFAADFVWAVLTTPSSKSAALQRYVTLPDSAAPTQAAPTGSLPAAVITTPKVWSVVPAGSTGDVGEYAVTIEVQQRPYASAEATRAFYRVPVAIWNYQPRAMDMPTPISDPGPGADVKIGYTHPLDPASPVYAVVSGFLTTYLTATSGLDRYVMADSWIKPVGGYHSAVLTTAATAVAIPDNAPAGTRIHVRAIVSAQTSQFAVLNFSFPLTVENSGGTWMIADIDLIPQTSDEIAATPVGAPHS
ncbi:hypothetical protein GGC64_006350 [Mycobacterium sp. OAS707]|uniref:conjugal transfer protein n=1 Tax=Mycobacterium sp. OAS707 TaxID=2663822 RepID=UPI0019DC37CF|nr:conjugal transfer protein [Mycobacterium sp. OAS707]MBE1552263.1 hypothetical protein [Mycobacterium sp. OAS707]